MWQPIYLKTIVSVFPGLFVIFEERLIDRHTFFCLLSLRSLIRGLKEIKLNPVRHLLRARKLFFWIQKLILMKSYKPTQTNLFCTVYLIHTRKFTFFRCDRGGKMFLKFERKATDTNYLKHGECFLSQPLSSCSLFKFSASS